MTDTITMEIDCHAYPWHVKDPLYPECGPDNLVRFAEIYAVVVEFLTDQRFGWSYQVTGPETHVRTFLDAEYGSCPFCACDAVSCACDYS
jgi:hypothetical protein